MVLLRLSGKLVIDLDHALGGKNSGGALIGLVTPIHMKGLPWTDFFIFGEAKWNFARRGAGDVHHQ